MKSNVKEILNLCKIDFLSGQKEEIFRQISGIILRNYGYNVISLTPEVLVSDDLSKSIEHGVDGVLYTKEIPNADYLNFKQFRPFNRDYISIDYRSNNFGNYNTSNDDFIFVKLMEFLPKSHYNKEILLEKLEVGKDIRIKGILSNKNPDYFFLIRNTFNKPRDDISENSLINAYLLPVGPLKLQVIDYLNIIRESNDLEPLELEKGIVDTIMDVYQTWQLYDKRYYDFELMKVRDCNKPDLFMKISKNELYNYIKFGSNGLIAEFKP